MATILRSSKCVRNFAEFAMKLGFSHIKTDVRVSLLSQRHSAPSTFAKSLATQVAAEHLDNKSNLDLQLQRLDAEIRRFGRTSKGKLESILKAFETSKSVSSSQALMVLRCCGDLVHDELPEVKSELVNKVWKSLENSGIELDLSHYNALLRVYIENEYAFSPTEVLMELERKGIEPNKLTYQRLINRYCQQGDIEGASKILEFMREKGISVNENIFTALVRGHSEANDMVSAADILSVMRQAGLEPSADTYKELLCGYAKHGDIGSITKTLSECESNNVHLLDTDFLDIIFSLASNGHAAHVGAILSIMPKEVGIMQDALNNILKLVHIKQIDVAMQVLSILPNRDQGYSGTPVMKQLAKADIPVSKLLDFCKQIQSKGINSRAILIALEIQLSQGNVEGSLAFLQALKEFGGEVREHYFWPVFVALGRSKNNEGIDDLLRSMRSDYGFFISRDTLRDFVIPNKTGEPDKIMSELLLIGLSPGLIAYMIIHNLVIQMKMKEAAAFAEQQTFRYNAVLFYRPLVAALAHTKDVTSFISILRHIYENRFHTKTIQNKEVDVDENILEPYIMELAAVINEENSETLTRVLEELLEGGYSGMSDACAKTLQRTLGNRFTPKLNRLLNRLRSKNTGFSSPPAVDVSACNAEISSLEESLNTSNNSEETTVGVKMHLLHLYCQIKNLPNIEKTVTDLKELGIKFNHSMYRQILDAYINSDELEKTEEYLTILKTSDPDYTLEYTRLMKYVVLLVKNNRIDDAVEILQQHLSKDSRKNRYNLSTLLNTVAELGNPQAVDSMFNMLLENNYIDLTSSILRPLIKVHLVRNDLQEAMSVFEKLCETYQQTPLKNELAKKLIQAEDATALQRLTDLSTQIHGEANSLYDLAHSFIECDCLRQAKRILEIPALHSKFHRIRAASKWYSEQGLTIYVERIVAVIKDVPSYKAIPQFYNDLLHCYNKENNWQKGLNLKKQMEEEEVEPSKEFLRTLAELLKRNNVPVPFTVPELKRGGDFSQQKESQLSRPARNPPQTSQKTKRNSRYDNLDRDSTNPHATCTVEETKQILSLTDSNQLHSAFKFTNHLLEKNTYPDYGTFKFLLRKAALAGEIELIKNIAKNLPDFIKRSVHFGNILCRVHIVTGKTEEYLEILDKYLESADDSNFDKVFAEIPVIAIRTLLQEHPELIEKYKKIAEKHAVRGITQPINTLWIHHFIHGEQEADEIWSEYLVKSPKIMFHPILEHAQRFDDSEIVRKLIKTFETAPFIDDSARGNAYSALIKFHYLRGNYQESVDVLREALKVVSVDNLEQSTLRQMKTYLAAAGLNLPTDISLKSQPTEARQRLIT